MSFWGTMFTNEDSEIQNPNEILLDDKTRRRIASYLHDKNHIPCLEASLDEYRKGTRKTMPLRHFKALIAQYGTDILDILIEG